MTDERKDTDTDTETGRTRRDLLKDAGALAVGASVGGAAVSMGGFDRLRRLFGDDTAPVSLTPVARVTAQSPSDPNYGQYRGGPGNRGVKESSLSPVGVENVEKYFGGKRIERPPVTSTDGKVAAPGVGAMYVLDLETGEETTLPATGETSFPIFDNAGHIIYGDTEKTRKADLETGDIKAEISGTNRGTIKKYDGKGYRSISGGIGEFDISDLDSQRLDQLEESPTEGAIAIFDNGSRFVTNQGEALTLYDIVNQEILNEKNNISVDQLSADDEFIYGTNGGKLFVWDHDLNRIDAVDKPGSTSAPPIPFEDENGNKKIYNIDSVTEGLIAAYELDSGSLTREWQEGIENGRAFELVLYGNSTLVSGSDGPVALNRKDGNELWSRNSPESAFFGMPYQERIPLGGLDGLYIAETNLDQLGSEAELDHEWREMPDRLTLGETGNFEHYLHEVSGEAGIEASVMYTLFAEDGGDEYEIEAPFDLGSGEQTTIPWVYEPVGETEDFEDEGVVWVEDAEEDLEAV